MITVRKAAERGQADHGWLKTFHTFSFASYFDPKHTKFRSLRVLNEDWIKGGEGFGTHPHENMEILTYIIEGELEHKDSMGNGSVIRPGELQRGRLEAGKQIEYTMPIDRHAWIQLINGKLILNGTDLQAGDGMAVDEEKTLTFAAIETSEFLLFDLA